MGVILVVGATGGVGQLVLRRSLDLGYRVRCLVRDITQARSILGNDIDLVFGDITKPETLTELVMSHVEAVICCTGVPVKPDQDTPENVEYQGVKNLVTVAGKYLPPANEKIIFDFTRPSPELKDVWGAIDDVVMGGVSASSFQFSENHAVFAGNVSTANSGGFASIRTQNFSPGFDLSGYTGVKLRVKGDGQRYKTFLRTESTWDGVGYSYSFDTIAHTWIDVIIPFQDLVPVFRAQTVPGCPPLDSSKIRAFQLMLSKFEYDSALNPKFTPGNFFLEVSSIKAYRQENLPQFVLVSSAGVTHPEKLGVKQLEEILTWKLTAEDSLKASGIPYTIIRPCGLTAEPGGKELILAQGDNITGKVSREDVAELCLQALKYQEACNLIFEVKAGDNPATSPNWRQLFSSCKSE